MLTALLLIACTEKSADTASASDTSPTDTTSAQDTSSPTDTSTDPSPSSDLGLVHIATWNSNDPIDDPALWLNLAAEPIGCDSWTTEADPHIETHAAYPGGTGETLRWMTWDETDGLHDSGTVTNHVSGELVLHFEDDGQSIIPEGAELTGSWAAELSDGRVLSGDFIGTHCGGDHFGG